MICISIGDYGLDACRKALKRCEKYRRQFPDLVAEIRLDLCGLGEDEVHELFSGSRIPLIATCRPCCAAAGPRSYSRSTITR